MLIDRSNPNFKPRELGHDRLVRSAEATQFLGLGRSAYQTLLDTGAIPSFRVSSTGKTRNVWASDLQNYVDGLAATVGS